VFPAVLGKGWNREAGRAGFIAKALAIQEGLARFLCGAGREDMLLSMPRSVALISPGEWLVMGWQ
jgi:hypothetical protein